VLCVKELKLKAAKTKDFVKMLGTVGANGTTLVVMDEIPEAVGLAARNVPDAAVIELTDLTPYDVVTADRLVFVKAALERLGGTSDAA